MSRPQEGTRRALTSSSTRRRPHHFDLTRDSANLLPFGVGAYYWLGAALARLELRITIGTLVERIPSMSVAGDPVIGIHIIMIGTKSGSVAGVPFRQIRRRLSSIEGRGAERRASRDAP